MINYQALYLPGLIFLVTIGFGFWVKARGRPYNKLLFNIHKLVALAGVLLSILRLKAYFSLNDLYGWMTPVLATVIISVVMLFTTGGVMSIKEDESRIALLLHRASPVIIVLCLIGAYFLI